MVKIIGILTIVLIYYCEINAEINNYQNGLTTGFPEPVGGTLLEHIINVFEALINHFEQRAVQSRRAKSMKTNEEIQQNKKEESDSSKHKKNKRHHNHSAKLKSYTAEEDLVDKKHKKGNTKPKNQTNHEHQKDKKGNTEKKQTDKNNKHKSHKDTTTEYSMDRDNDASIQNTARGISEIKENYDKKQTKETVDKPKKKNSKESKEVAKSKDDMKIAKLLGKSLPSSKYIKVKPGNITKKVQTSTSTLKPQSKVVREGGVDRTVYKLSANKNKMGENIRQRQLTMSGEGGGEGGNEEGNAAGHPEGGGGHVDDNGGGDGRPKTVYESHDSKKYPSYLSPYAITEQMEGLMKILSEEFPNANATVTKFARTVEYNDLVMIMVTDKKESERYSRSKDSKYIDDAPEKKIIFIVHGLTVMGMKSMTSLVQMSQLKLLFSYYFKYLDKFDFYIMPLANPDGYSASRSLGRPIWNKNMSPQSECPGVFVDRNFDIGWNVSKEMSSCSQLYPGPTPFSEVESKAVRDVFHYFSHKILAYIHVHSGTYDEKVFKGDAILYPRGYTESQSDDDKYIDLKGEIDEAMKNASFRVISVSVETLASWYGVVSGSSVDYAASVFGIPYALEFVMQIYDPESLNNNALTQIWSRLIDTTLNNMWKSLSHGSEERRLH